MCADRRPTLDVETEEWSAGSRLLAGLDEAGRGALAGPVVAGAVVLPWRDASTVERLSDVRDSKLMSPAARCRAYSKILAAASGVGVGTVGAEGIDVLGIGHATQLAMARALAALPVFPDKILVDGLTAPMLKVPQQAIVGGDRKVLSIAAASVVAKLYRDSIMIGLSFAYPEYGFDQHKGYGTERHTEAICRHGPCRHHRLSWAPLQGTGALRVVRQPHLPGFHVRDAGLPGGSWMPSTLSGVSAGSDVASDAETVRVWLEE